MTAQVFARILPPQIIEKISIYQYNKKDSEFIVRWMIALSQQPNPNYTFWKFLIRDSENLIIQLPEHELSRFNFSHFIEHFMKCFVNHLSKQFEVFCKNIIRNNPKLLLNRYYVGNGGYPCFQLISTYLFSNTINGTQYFQPDASIFNIYQFMMENQYISQEKCYYFFSGFNHGNFTASYAVQVLKIFFKTYEPFLLDAELQDNNADDYRSPRTMISDFFKNLFQKLSRKKQETNYARQFWYKKMRVDEQGNEIETEIRKKNIKQFLNYFQQYHFAILHKYKKYLTSSYKFINFKVLQYLINLPGFKPILFSEDYVYYLIQRRKFRQFQVLWSFEENREKMSKFQLNHKNILQVAAQSRGLSQNIIDILWRSKLFQALPQIKNQKSKNIIRARFMIAGHQD